MSVSQDKSAARSVVICVVTGIAAVMTYYLLPGDMNELARRTAAIFLVAAVFWATEALPLYATSLCIIGMEIVFLADSGGMAGTLPTHSAWPTDDAGLAMHLGYKTFLSSFASPVIMLFMGGFLLSSAVTRHGLDRVIASKLLRPFTGTPLRMVFGVLGITAFFSMWMSNTATAAMMLAIVAPLLRQLPKDDRFHRAVILAVPFGANIGGIGTPIGTPPNAVALGALRDAGYHIGFLEWMMMAVPLAFLLVVVTGFLLYWLYRPTQEIAIPQIEKAPKLDGSGRMTLLILGCTILLWLTSKYTGISDAAVALLAAAALTTFRVLDKKDVDNIDWNVLLLMWGGLSLGGAMQATGLVDYVMGAPLIQNINSMSGPWGGFVWAACIIFMAVGLGTFMSHTAAAALIVPMVMGLSPDSPVPFVVLTALAASFAMAMPVSTPPNAIAFATGNIPAGTMIRSGGIISIISCLTLLVGHQAVFPLVLANSQVVRTTARRVAVMVPQTGDRASMGALQMSGYEMAEQKLRPRGITVRYFDTGSFGIQLAGLYEKEVLPWKPDVIVGPYSSEAASSLAKAVTGIPVIVPTANVDRLTQTKGSSLFRISPPMQMMAVTAADFLVSRQGSMPMKQITILAEDSPYGKAASAAIAGNCMMRQLPKPTSTFFQRGQVQSLAIENDEEVVWILVTRHVEDAKQLIKRLQNKKFVLGFAGAFSTPALRQGQFYCVSQWNEDSEEPLTRQFMLDYLARYQTRPQYHSVQAYSALQAAGIAVEMAVKEEISPATVLQTHMIGTPIGQVQFIDFAGYYQQNPAATVIQKINVGQVQTIFPLSRQ